MPFCRACKSHGLWDVVFRFKRLAQSKRALSNGCVLLFYWIGYSRQYLLEIASLYLKIDLDRFQTDKMSIGKTNAISQKPVDSLVNQERGQSPLEPDFVLCKLLLRIPLCNVLRAIPVKCDHINEYDALDFRFVFRIAYF